MYMSMLRSLSHCSYAYRLSRRAQVKRLTHLPTTQLQPMMQELSHECDLTMAPLSSVVRLMHAPSSITTFGPTVTFGPIRQFWPIFAVGC